MEKDTRQERPSGQLPDIRSIPPIDLPGFAAQGARSGPEILVTLLREGQACRFVATGASMQPLIRHGDELIVDPLSRAPGLGDVVVCQPSAGRGSLLIHRVIRKCPNRIQIKGDNRLAPDGWFNRTEIVGIVRAVYRGQRPIRLGNGPERFILGILSRFAPLSRWLRPWRWFHLDAAAMAIL